MSDFINAAGESILTAPEILSQMEWDGLRARVRRPPTRFVTRQQLNNTSVLHVTEANRMANLVRLLGHMPYFWRFCWTEGIYPLHLWEWAVNTILDHDEERERLQREKEQQT